MVGVIQVSGSITVPLFGLFSAVPGLKALKPVWEKIKVYTANSGNGECHTEREDAVAFKGCTGNKVDVGGAGANCGRWQEISAEHLGFSYPGSNSEVLKDVSLTIEHGKKHLMVGESGGGKSTLASLITRFFDVNDGSIRIGGADIRDITKEELMNTVSFVFQNSKLIKA